LLCPGCLHPPARGITLTIAALRAVHAGTILLACLFTSGGTPRSSFESFLAAYTERFEALDADHFTLDMREWLNGVASDAALAQQAAFFSEEGEALSRFERASLGSEHRLLFDLVADHIDYHRQRVELEQRWSLAGRPLPRFSLFDLPEHEAWYALFVRRFTGTDISPVQVFRLGEQETDRCRAEIDRIRVELGFNDGASFQRFLGGPRFIITDKDELVASFARIDSLVRRNLEAFVQRAEVPAIGFVEWPGAGPSTPPARYLSRDQGETATDALQFNFYGGRYNSRNMTWIYLHEAVPGHHLQFSHPRHREPDDLRNHLLFPGNFEGWACYVEYHGDDLGVYKDPYQRLGKWEWDLVRSVRLVLDCGIHYYGWSHQQALEYWNEHVPGQAEIAEREVTRVTNWAAQALSYKVGAERLQRMREQLERRLGPRFDPAAFHRAFLDMGQVPISVVERNIAGRLED
jgi:uncharacterized protein (DUF885 family)